MSGDVVIHATYGSVNALVKKSEDLSCNMFSSSLLMIHNSSARSQHNISDASRGQELINPLLQIRKSDVEARGNDSTFIQTSIQLNDDLAGAVVIDFLKFANVA
jgi:hypothetical protein